MILRARYVLPMATPPIENGAVLVRDGKVTAVGPVGSITGSAVSEPVHDLGDVVLAPGLINAHCHLEYTCLRGEVEWRGSFVEWLAQMIAAKKLHSARDYAEATARGAEQLLDFGTTTVVNIVAFPRALDELPGLPLRTIWCLELIDLFQNKTPQEILAEAEGFLDARPHLAGQYGFSPHAPYSASVGLYMLTARAAAARGVILTTHLAETAEEDDMFRRGTGPMYDYFLRAGRDMSDCKRLGPVQLLAECGVLGPNCLAVHVNCLTPADAKTIARTGTHVVHCPKSHRYFARGVPMLSALWEHGVNVCLGTDSLASNDSLNMFAEMHAFSLVYPRLPPKEILEMATRNPARALGLAGRIGEISPGAYADLIAVSCENIPDPYEAVVFAEQPVRWAMIGGKVVRS